MQVLFILTVYGLFFHSFSATQKAEVFISMKPNLSTNFDKVHTFLVHDHEIINLKQSWAVNRIASFNVYAEPIMGQELVGPMGTREDMLPGFRMLIAQ